MYQRANEQFISDLEKAINGEYSAIQCYEVLGKLAPREDVHKRMEEIRHDEMHHLKKFMELYRSLTGKQAVPKLIEKCPAQFLTGVESSLIDEQNTVDFYLEMADRSPNQQMKEIFNRAAKDEQNHAVWFLYMYTKYHKF